MPYKYIVKSAFFALALLIVFAFPLTSAYAAPTPSVTLSAFHNLTEYPTGTELPVGATWDYLVNYSCAVESCDDYKIEIPLPAGVNVSSPSYGPDVASYATTGTIETGITVTFTMIPTLPPGTSGQISFSGSTPVGVTEDNSSFSTEATMSSFIGPTVVSGTVTIVTRADVEIRTEAELSKGGTVDDIARYQISACLDPKDPSSVWGFLSTEPSTLVVTLPEGAEFVESNPSGTFEAGTGGNPDTVTYAISARTDLNCLIINMVLNYPDSDPSNIVGAEKELEVDWTVAKLGASEQVYHNSAIHELIAPIDLTAVGTVFFPTLTTPRDYGDVPTKKVAVGENISIESLILNNTDSSLTSSTVTIPVPDIARPTSVTLSNPGRSDMTAEIKTTCGPDRTNGTSDDGDWEPAATIDAGDSETFDPESTWPSLAPGIDDTCHILSIRAQVGRIWPASTGSPISIVAEIQENDHDDNEVIAGDDFEIEADYSGSNLNGPVTTSVSLNGEIDEPVVPIPVIGVRNFGPGALDPGDFEGDFTLSMTVNTAPLNDPVMTVLLPLNTTLTTWSGSPTDWTGAPTPTKTEISDWQGTGRTLVRWTFPSGTVMPYSGTASGYNIAYTLTLNEYAYGSLSAFGYGGTADPDAEYNCLDNYFAVEYDSNDTDDDGNTEELLCRWDGGITPNASATASLSFLIKGSWDSAFVSSPGTGFSSPGSNDTYKIVVKNNGRVELSDINIVNRLPKPGDTNVLTTTPRNPSSDTFPVLLRAKPTLPTLDEEPILYYSTATGNVCQPELNYSPSGCTNPNWQDWDLIPPLSFSSVTMIRVDFGDTVLKPGYTLTIELPVTTPTSGASEPDFAIPNPDALTVDNEYAINTAAFRARRGDNSSLLNASEPPGVRLEMPSSIGPLTDPPEPDPLTTTGAGTTVHNISLTLPLEGTVHLLDGDGDEVTTLVVDGVGTYEVNPTTGVMTFTPEPGYLGEADPVDYRITDGFDQSGDSTWTATVTLPPAPETPDVTTQGERGAVQNITITVPRGGSIILIDEEGDPTESIAIDGVGTYEIDPDTGVITFTPVSGYVGTVPPATYRVTDSYDQSTTGSYQPVIVQANDAQNSAQQPSTNASGSLAATGTSSFPLVEVAMALVAVGFVLLRGKKRARTIS